MDLGAAIRKALLEGPVGLDGEGTVIRAQGIEEISPQCPTEMPSGFPAAK
jgi:hypothetical protein